MNYSKFGEIKKDRIPVDPDYATNLNWAGKFIRNYNDVYAGTAMQIYIRDCVDSEHQYILMEYTLRTPDQEIGKTVWANPISPNQKHDDFLAEFKHTYLRYKTFVKKYAVNKETSDFFETIPNKKA